MHACTYVMEKGDLVRPIKKIDGARAYHQMHVDRLEVLCSRNLSSFLVIYYISPTVTFISPLRLHPALVGLFILCYYLFSRPGDDIISIDIYFFFFLSFSRFFFGLFSVTPPTFTMYFSSVIAVLALEWVAVASGVHVPFVKSNGTAIITPPVPTLSPTATSTFSLLPTTATPETSTLEPIKAGVSYMDTTSIVSVLYEPTGSMTTLMVAPGEPTAEATIPRAGFRTSTSGSTEPALASATPTPSSTTTTVATDSGAGVSHMAPRGLLWGCVAFASLAYGMSII